MRKFVSAEENNLYVDAMLKGNEVIEEALEKWKNDSTDIGAMLAVYKSFIDRDRECGGLIVSVESRDIPAGADHIEFFNGDKRLYINRAKGEFGDNLLMVCTSRDRFRECNDTAGVVMFIRAAFSLLSGMEDADGILINLRKEEIVIDKQTMQHISRMIEISDSYPAN